MIRNLVVRLCPPRLLTSGGSGRRPSLFLAALLALAASLCVLLAAPWPVSGQQSDGEAPAKPTGLTGTVLADRVSLSWDDPGDSSITGYRVLRRNPAIQAKDEFTIVEDDTGSASTNYTDTTVEPETRYFYRVKARNVHGLSERSGYVEATTPEEPVLTPATPARPTVTSITHDSVTISWTDPGDSSITGYQVLRRNRDTDAAGDFTVIEDDTAMSDTSYADDSVQPETPYVYRVKARNVHGLSDWSGFVRADTPAAPENSAASGSPAITGTARVGETLSVGTAGIADANGLSNVEYAYRWVRSTGGTDTDITGATGATYTLVRGDLDHTIRVRVSFTDDDGYPETLTSAATATVNRPPNATASGQPAITGTVEMGETLTVGTSGISDGNGLSNPQYGYQWVRSIGGTDTDISGATGSTYTLTASHLAHTVKVKASFTDDDGYSETLTSNATDTVNRSPNAIASGQPAITGTVEVGETLTADISGIDDDNGLSNPQYAYQWVHSVGGTDTNILAATGSSYTIASSDAGNAFKVKASFTDDDGYSETLTSNATDILLVAQQQQDANVPASGVPVITGTVQVGKTLTADISGIDDENGMDDNPEFRYQWVVRDSHGINSYVSVFFNNNAPTYTILLDDLGDKIWLEVSFQDDDGYYETRSSRKTVVVTKPPNQRATGKPAITGAAEDGETLFTGTSAITDGNGMTNPVFRYQWLRTSAGADTEIPGAIHCAYTPGSEDEDKTVKVRVRFTDDVGHSESRTSNATATIGAVQTQGQTSLPEPAGGDLPADTCTTGRVAIGGMVTGNISQRNDVDWYKVELTKGFYYRFDLMGAETNDGTLEDPELLGIAVQDGHFVTPHGDSDSGEGDNARITWKPSSTGAFFLAVGSWKRQMGTYSLTASQIGSGIDTIPANATTTAEVGVGGSLLYVIQTPNDHDWIKVDLEVDKLYRIELANFYTTGQAEHQYPALFKLRDPDPHRNPIPYTTVVYDSGVSDHDRWRQDHAVVEYRAQKDGKHYVDAGASVGTSGMFMISVEEIQYDGQ